VLDPEVVSQLLVRRTDLLALLTPREHDVLALMAEGRSNAGVAAALVVSESAVAKHVNSIFTKLALAPANNDHRRVLAVTFSRTCHRRIVVSWVLGSLLSAVVDTGFSGSCHLARFQRCLSPTRRPLPDPHHPPWTIIRADLVSYGHRLWLLLLISNGWKAACCARAVSRPDRRRSLSTLAIGGFAPPS